MYQESFIESFGQNAPPLGTAFHDAHDRIGTDTHNSYGTDTNNEHMSDQGGYNLGSDYHTQITYKLADIESLINSNSYTAAAEELLKINIGSLPWGVFERFNEILEQTVNGLYGKDTYLNAQLATQSLTVIAVSDAVEEMSGPLHLFGVNESATIDSLNLNIPLSDPGESCLPILVWNDFDESIGMADEYNVQLSSDTGALARYMANETIGNHRAASLDHGGPAGRHAYIYELKFGF